MKVAHDDIKYTKEAFLNSWNLVFLSVALVTTFLTSGLSSPLFFNLALILTAAAELLYLGIVPRNERFRQAVRAQKAAERHKPPSQKELYRQLTRRSQRHYARLRNREERIRTNYRKLSYASQGLLDSHLQKIDGLLTSYLNLLHQKERYRDHADSAAESEIRRSIEALHEDTGDDSDRVRSINQRRLRILERRLKGFEKSHENLAIIEAQLEAIADTIKYIHEQSWTLKDPEEVTLQLDTLLDEVEETKASVEEVEEIFDRSGDLLDDVDAYAAPETSRQESSRTRG